MADHNTDGLSASGDAARQKMQIKSFTAWVNLHLNKASLNVDDLKTDFCDGIKLLRLVEIISEEELGKYNKNPTSKFQKVENLNIPLKFINSFLVDVGIRNSYSAENILEENTTLILGMVWSLILRYSVQEVSEGDKTAKEGLLLWAKTKVGEVSKGAISINNFHTSWQDGIAFNALIQAYRPDLVDYQKLNPKSKMENLDHAFELAHSALDIPKLLDAQDMVTMRPDEKSVMTYVSFFWKCFAANKRKKIAGERIAHVVQREQAYADLEAQYLDNAAKLAGWISEKKAELETEPQCNSQAELEVVIREYQEYVGTEKPRRQRELLELEALFSSISSRLATLNRSFAPADEAATATLARWWEGLALAEQAYSKTLQDKLKGLKMVEYNIKLFHSKSTKMEDWLQQKEAWLAFRDVKPPLATAAAVPAPAPAPMAIDEETATADPPADPLLEAPRSRSGSMLDAVAGVFAPSRRASTEARSRRTSEVMAPPAVVTATDDVEAAEGSPIRQRPPVQVTTRSAPSASLPAPPPLSMSPLNSVSAVQAKLNMFAAHEEEFSDRVSTVPELEKLLERIIGLGCPPMRQFSLTNRLKMIKEYISTVEELGAEHKAMLLAQLERQQKLDEMRLEFAKRAEALFRVAEETHDTLTEVFVVESIAEAEAQVAELDGVGQSVDARAADLGALTRFAEEMASAGITDNPYSRRDLPSLIDVVDELRAALAHRREDLNAALERQRELDSFKRDFATAAEAVLTFVRTERAEIDAAAPALAIVPDDLDAIARGKEVLAALDERLGAEAREARATALAPARELTDKLMEATELENPFTSETMASLTSHVEQLEKVLSDKRSLVEGQLARAQVEITPEQHKEVTAAFQHFDKSGDGLLSQLEFAAVVKAMDFELSAEEEEATFAKLSEPTGPEGENLLTLDAFITFVLQQFKDKDTFDQLLAAFATVSAGKDFVTGEDLRSCVPEAEFNFLLSHLTLKDDHGLDFAPFAKAVYGKE